MRKFRMLQKLHAKISHAAKISQQAKISHVAKIFHNAKISQPAKFYAIFNFPLNLASISNGFVHAASSLARVLRI